MDITPTNVVFTATDGITDAKYGMFAIITTKNRAMTGAAAEQTAPISNGGWTWIASDGQTISTLDGEATSVTIDRYNDAGPVEPGAYQLDLEVFDLTPTQTQGGTLVYRDGDGMAHKWKMPSKDTGPEVPGLKKELQ
ncbi:hypothetical protein KY5_7664c [Streptomyces formicae]|uniref:Uncharacterized protein n=1 Tax=Streptomyces formicae TaxID=1616117 RepID=A0A291QMA5_9ACTN|nr:hypothetical protein KY5_7664c [Streptomyces formicae]